MDLSCFAGSLVLLALFAAVCNAVDCSKFEVATRMTTMRLKPSTYVGKIGRMRCASKCSAVERCPAFHVTPDDGCHLLEENFKEDRDPRSLKVWYRENFSSCTESKFPKVFGNSRYLVEKRNRKNWRDAARYCNSLGAKLAQISSVGELKFLRGITDDSTNTSLTYIGLREIRTGIWKWHRSFESFNPNLEVWSVDIVVLLVN